ncbi:hypothetical protein GYMLUDRAFT_161573 [Collybiopsis luxurians FD-317 M1]|uniref:Hemerythrin-like domain-containing protein n=1 Tax=Collybiopsis luxurians FD-317 M1 TaxID=944289 RepID=A0A0D0D479_9AGAR|nr:hypothetical protein GYMLUDRAFT_161573 [Collybiopsis luxurians FD-317 M1]
MANKLVAFLVGLSAAFVSYQLYNPQQSALITMTGPEMKTFESPEVLKYVERMQAAATPERPALSSDRGRWAMAWFHLVIWNSWKSAYFYADKFPEGDFQHYSEYALLAATCLMEHHEAEEAALFPALEKKIKGSMEQNEAQHQAFLKQLQDIIEYIRSTQISAVKFDATTYRAKVDVILEPIMQHLSDELDSLEGPKLLEHFSESELDAINKSVHKAQQGDNHKMLPFILQNLPPGSPFPPAPGFVRTLLGPWVFYWKYSQLWKASIPPIDIDYTA